MRTINLICRCLIVMLLLSSMSSARASVPLSSSPIFSFADIIEPLLPTVVNVYTVRHSESSENYKSLVEVLLVDKLNKYLEEFNFPFALNNISNSSNTFALGSGFIVDEFGDIITNYHVVSGSDEVFIKLSDNTEVPARVIGSDPKTDLALLKIDVGYKLPFVHFGNSSSLRVGDLVIAIGNPLGFGGTVTTGIISSKGRDLGEDQEELVGDFIQTDAAINTGNSGGPLFNLKGEVIGLNTSLPEISGGMNIGIGFAIPSNTVKSIMSQLREKGKISRGKLDISVQQMTQELAEALSFSESQGVLVVNVKAGGVGEKAGLRLRDLILEFNGHKVSNSRKLQLLVAECNIGARINLTVLRGNKRIHLYTHLIGDDMPDMLEPQMSINEKESVDIDGVVLANISDDMRIEFGIDDDVNGLMIVGTKPDCAADIKVGDILLSIEDVDISDIAQLDSIMEHIIDSGKRTMLLLIKRGDVDLFVPWPVRDELELIFDKENSDELDS